jgi:hypothetical protein
LLFKEEEAMHSERESSRRNTLESQKGSGKKIDGLMFEYANEEQAE